jgi:hypothetical protein
VSIVADTEELTRFAEDLRQQVWSAAELEGEEALRLDCLTRQFISDLTEAGELDDGDACYHRATGMEASGYGLSTDELTLNVFATIGTEVVPPATVGRREVEACLRRLTNFTTRALHGYHAELEEASPVFDMAQRIHEMRGEFAAFRLFLFTDGVVTLDRFPEGAIDGRPASFHLWDLRRLFRCVTSGQHREPIRVELSDFGGPLPCLATAESGDGRRYTTYLTIVPGSVLADIYARYGPRLLELNVRSFLQTRGKVNRAIRKTLVEDSGDFLAYNNGISATASHVDLTELPAGGWAISAISDLQIVNGGQTTASIYQAQRRDRADISKVAVQAKLTVVSDGDLSTFVPLISRYANSQNKVNEADFSANDPFHVALEKLSRSIWSPAGDGSQRQTRWFYERARGQYQDSFAREVTPARQRQWRELHPANQRFTKTDLAKFENTWDQLPHLVSLGAEKNFREFTVRLARRAGFVPDEVYWRQLVAKGILFRRAERLVGQEGYGGYRANIVAYTLARISHATAKRVDLEEIWQHQTPSPLLERCIVEVSRTVHSIITNPPGGRNVTEWCKREECWTRVREAPVSLPPDLASELLTVERRIDQRDGIETANPAEVALIDRLRLVSGQTWFEISRWAAQTQNLAGWQRQLAFGLGRFAKQERPPTRKQAVQAAEIVREAHRLGFRPTSEPTWEQLVAHVSEGGS